MAATVQNVTVYQGATLTLELVVSGLSSLAGAVVMCRVKRKQTDADSAAVITKSTTNGGAVITSTGDVNTPGTIDIQFDASDTAALSPANYLYDVKIAINGAVIEAIAPSTFAVVGAIAVSMT